MPVIYPKNVVSFTSEDKVQCADNLLKPETYRKWRTASGGEGQASVVLEFSKAEEIHSVDVGNEGATFVEILVGDADAQAKVDFEVLLGASAFMTPAEAKSWTNVNKVRFFGPEKLNKTAREKRWTRVKIVATQNFDKTHPFGLAFVKFRSPPEKEVENKQEPVKKFGAFGLKENGTTSPKPFLAAGSLFDKVKKEPETKPPADSAAAIRLGAVSPKTSPFQFKKKFQSPRPIFQPAQTPKVESLPLQEKPKPVDNSGLYNTTLPKKRPSSPTSPAEAFSAKKKKLGEKAAVEVPFSKTLAGVTFSLSGYQNPLRGTIRDKALEMGAKYKGDWDSSCTHLVCAFSNTPKFQQVLGKGKIVTKRWIEDCHKERKRLPWRDYRLDDGSSGSDSDPEPTKRRGRKRSGTPVVAPVSNATPERLAAQKSFHDDEDEAYNATTEVDSDVEVIGGRPGGGVDDDEPNTEDELEKLLQGKEQAAPKPVKEDEDSLPDLPALPDFLSGKHFMLFGSFDAGAKKLLKRYIIGYGGEMSLYMNDSVDFVITTSTWDSNFDDAIADNPDLNFVRPKWLKICHQRSKLVPYQPYIVAPPMDDDDDD